MAGRLLSLGLVAQMAKCSDGAWVARRESATRRDPTSPFHPPTPICLRTRRIPSARTRSARGSSTWAYLSCEYGGGHGGDYDEDDHNNDDYDDVDNGDGLPHTDGRPPILYEEGAFKLAKAQSKLDKLAKWDILAVELRDSAMAQEACDASMHTYAQPDRRLHLQC
jgi:hypothetical protein